MTRYFRTYRTPHQKPELSPIATASAEVRMPARQTFAVARDADPLATFMRPSISVPRSHGPLDNDVCAFLFARCQEWQKAFLDDAGLTCLFDVDSGSLPSLTCDRLAAIARSRLRRLAADVVPPGGTVTVALRHRAPMWALAITDSHLRIAGPRIAPTEMAALKAMATKLEGAYVIQPTDSGTMLAVLFSTEPGVLCADALADGRAQFRQ